MSKTVVEVLWGPLYNGVYCGPEGTITSMNKVHSHGEQKTAKNGNSEVIYSRDC